MSRTVAIIQARCSSGRFAGKVLKPLGHVPLILFMVERVRQAQSVDELVLATSDHSSDDALADLAMRADVRVHRGPLDDVLARFAGAARSAAADTVVRLTGDCPLIDADLIDAVVQALRSSGADYASNCHPPMWPDGLDVEAMSRSALDAADREARLPSQREHVTPFLREDPQRFRATHLRALVDLSSLRWTVDYPDDLRFLNALLAAAGVTGPSGFDRYDLVRALERQPRLADINRHQRNEGYAQSVAADPTP